MCVCAGRVGRPNGWGAGGMFLATQSPPAWTGQWAGLCDQGECFLPGLLKRGGQQLAEPQKLGQE